MASSDYADTKQRREQKKNAFGRTFSETIDDDVDYIVFRNLLYGDASISRFRGVNYLRDRKKNETRRWIRSIESNGSYLIVHVAPRPETKDDSYVHSLQLSLLVPGQSQPAYFFVEKERNENDCPVRMLGVFCDTLNRLTREQSVLTLNAATRLLSEKLESTWSVRLWGSGTLGSASNARSRLIARLRTSCGDGTRLLMRMLRESALHDLNASLALPAFVTADLFHRGLKLLTSDLQSSADLVAKLDRGVDIPDECRHILNWYFFGSDGPVLRRNASAWAARASIGGVSYEVYDVLYPGGEPRRFRRKREIFGSLTAYHGSGVNNFASILFFGLRNLSGTSKQANGAAFGSGIYLAHDFDVAKTFAAVSKGSAFEPRISVVAVCEVVKSPGLISSKLKTKAHTYYIAKDPGDVFVRQVIVCSERTPRRLSSSSRSALLRAPAFFALLALLVALAMYTRGR